MAVTAIVGLLGSVIPKTARAPHLDTLHLLDEW
jgi:hypothetical protein